MRISHFLIKILIKRNVSILIFLDIEMPKCYTFLRIQMLKDVGRTKIWLSTTALKTNMWGAMSNAIKNLGM